MFTILVYSKEDPQHAVKPFARLQEKDKIFDFKHQKGKVLIKVKQEWAKDRDFWKQLEFPEPSSSSKGTFVSTSTIGHCFALDEKTCAMLNRAMETKSELNFAMVKIFSNLAGFLVIQLNPPYL